VNKIKIYFSPRWIKIAPPWIKAPDDLKDSRNTVYHDIGIDLTDHRAYVCNDDYYCNVGAGEMRALQKMLEYAADICFAELTFDQVKSNYGLTRSSFPDAEIFIVEE
jgi:hypothetical protein